MKTLRTRRRRRDERGAAAVEFALISVVLITMILGIIEFTFLLRDYTVVVADTRAGARIASTGADAGKGTCESGPEAPVCSPDYSPALAQLAADAIQRSGSAMDKDQIEYILVYKANDKGYPGSMTSMPADCSGVASCVRFKWRPAQDAFRFADGSWVSSTISACFPGTATAKLDRVGVYMRVKHPSFTGLFFNDLTLSDHTVMEFEPLATAMCEPGKHQ